MAIFNSYFDINQRVPEICNLDRREARRFRADPWQVLLFPIEMEPKRKLNFTGVPPGLKKHEVKLTQLHPALGIYMNLHTSDCTSRYRNVSVQTPFF